MKDLFRFETQLPTANPKRFPKKNHTPGEFDDTKIQFIEIEWEKYGKQESNASQAREDVGEIITTINTAAGFNDAFSTGFQTERG